LFSFLRKRARNIVTSKKFGKLCFPIKTPLADHPNRCFASAVSQPYEEILDGASLPRSAPDERHELICQRLLAAITAQKSRSPAPPPCDPISR
jgi:hypothetical protein